jgi:thiamine phosphate synthase YjbQ (UPF0047 family)
MTVLQVSTKSKREIFDLTRLFQKELPQVKKANGLCHLFLLHTTAALTTAGSDPGTSSALTQSGFDCQPWNRSTSLVPIDTDQSSK